MGLIKKTLLPTIIVIVIGHLIYQTISSDTAALLVETNVESNVFIDGVDHGKTPLEIEIEAKEVLIKIVPTERLPFFYETKLRMVKNIKTIVRREFGEGKVESSGQIISFEKNLSNKAEMAIVSAPDNAKVAINGEFKGTTPLRIKVAPETYEILVESSGYEPTNFVVNAIEGYVLTASTDLAIEPQIVSDGE